jgi:phosphotransferase system  glucose/maltose/N-acetylglucosamine-specific IIC component
MFVMMAIIFPLILGEGLTQRKILIGIPIWIIAGLIFGIIMKVFIGKRKIETQNQKKNCPQHLGKQKKCPTKMPDTYCCERNLVD